MDSHEHPLTRPVSLRALVARINRKLRRDGEQLRTARGDGARAAFGDHFLVDVRRNALCATHVDVEELAGELGVLLPVERLVSQT